LYLLHRDPEIGEDDVLPDPLQGLKEFTVDLKSPSFVSVKHLKQARKPGFGFSVPRFQCLVYVMDECKNLA
jgi:hypothetical protein